MAGNKHPWRDVISVNAWQQVLLLTANDPSRAQENTAPLDMIKFRLQNYHKLPKSDRTQFGARITALNRLAEVAEQYLLDKHKSTAYQKTGGAKGKQAISPRSLQYSRPNTNIAPQATEQSIDRWIYSIARRAGKKAAYLQTLDNYLSTNNNSAPINGFAAFSQHLKNYTPPAQPELLSLAPGVEPEAWDPFHRPIEVTVDLASASVSKGAANAMSAAFVQWYQSSTTLHFLVWLENHPICTFSKNFDQWTNSQGVSPLEVSSIQYGSNKQVREVYLSGGDLYARPFGSVDATSRLNTSNTGTKPGEAYVWLDTGELLIHPHISGVFHHSSFNGGGRVRCAGTMTVSNGKITKIDNNSGHYKPSSRHFLTLLNIFQQRNALDSKAIMKTHDLYVTNNAGPQPCDLGTFQQLASTNNVLPFIVANAIVKPFYG